MSYCGNCGSKLPEGVKFCVNCGAPVIPIDNIDRDSSSAVFEALPQKTDDQNSQAQNDMAKELEVKGIDRFGKFYGVILLLISIVDLFSDPPLVTIILSALIIVGGIYCLLKKYRLKGFTIAALVVAAICLILGILQTNKYGMLKTQKDAESEIASSDESDSVDTGMDDQGSGQVDDKVKTVMCGRITFSLPEKYIEDTDPSSSNYEIFHTKNSDARFEIGVENGSVQGWQFHNQEARELATDEFLEMFGRRFSNPQLEKSEYDEVAGLDSIIFKCACDDNGEEVKCSIACIHDGEGDCSVIILHLYYDRASNEYADDFDKLLETAVIGTDPRTNIQSSTQSTSNYDDKEADYILDKEVELGGLKYDIPEVFEFGFYKIDNSNTIPYVIGERNIFFVTIELNEDNEYLKNYDSNDVGKVNDSLKEASIKQLVHMQMPERAHTSIKESFGQSGDYLYYLRNFDAGFQVDNSGIKTITYYTKTPEYNDALYSVIYVYRKDEVFDDNTFEETISSSGIDIDFIESVSKGADTDSSQTGGVDPALKAALDDYEAFMNKYVDFMKKYSSEPGNAISMLGEYTDMLSQYAKYVDKIEEYDKKKSEMSKEDLKYYMDVLNRVEKKMIDVVH